MPTPRNEDVAAAQSAGLFGNLSGLLGAKLAYLRARLRLAGIEGKEAAALYAVIIAMAIVGLILVIFGYFFMVIALVFLVASFLRGEHPWIWVMLGAAVLHFGVAAALVFIAKAKLSTPVFTATLDELRKDQEWLKTKTKQS